MFHSRLVNKLNLARHLNQRASFFNISKWFSSAWGHPVFLSLLFSLRRFSLLIRVVSSKNRGRVSGFFVVRVNWSWDLAASIFVNDGLSMSRELLCDVVDARRASQRVVVVIDLEAFGLEDVV